MPNSKKHHASVLEIRCKDWRDAFEVGRSLNSARFVFRGHSDARWKLATTLERAALSRGIQFNYLRQREIDILHGFKGRAHHYIASPPAHEDHVEWLALIQHHGGPTRLLDITFSFYVAAFFAMDAAADEAAVWCFSQEALMGGHRLKSGELRATPKRRAERIVELGGKPTSKYLRRQEVRIELAKLANGYFGMQSSRADLILIQPYRLNERMVAQQGAFLMPLLPIDPFDVCLRGFLNGVMRTASAEPETKVVSSTSIADVAEAIGYPLVKIVIPGSQQLEALDELQRMNISSASLFPGLDGFARSLKQLVRPPEGMGWDQKRE